MSSIYAPGAHADADHYGPRGMIAADDRLTIPGKLVLFCQADRAENSVGGYGIIRMMIPNAPPQAGGLHVTLTPDGLRHFASQMVAMATDLEAQASREASAAIARAQGAGK